MIACKILRTFIRRGLGFGQLLLRKWQSSAPLLLRCVGTRESRLGNLEFPHASSFSKQDEDRLYIWPSEVVATIGCFDRISIDRGIDIVDDWLTSASEHRYLSWMRHQVTTPWRGSNQTVVPIQRSAEASRSSEPAMTIGDFDL
jgi:hypothetical protein